MSPPQPTSNPYFYTSASTGIARQVVATVQVEDDVKEEWNTPHRRKLLQEATDQNFYVARSKWQQVLHS